MWTVKFWEDQRGKCPVEEWFKSLAKPDQKEVAKLFGLLSTFGYELGLPHAKNLGGGVYELRTRSKGAGYRVYYTFQKGSIIVLLVAGNKSSQERDIEKAKKIRETL